MMSGQVIEMTVERMIGNLPQTSILNPTYVTSPLGPSFTFTGIATTHRSLLGMSRLHHF